MEQTELPQDFVRLVHEHYDQSVADVLCEALVATEPEVSIRLNPYKLTAADVLACHPDLEPVPWCADAFYLADRPPFTFDPLFHAGAYYVQEAASMYVAEIIREQGYAKSTASRPLLALDLCAAPGGKSTLLQSLLPEGSLLVSNEPIAKRCQILSENMQKWMTGQSKEAPRVIVTQKYPAEFGLLAGRADILLTDVPCSGEGMFRKDVAARQEWSVENVAMCQQRQRDILSDIWHVLKPGGLLVYSTCTFNRFEDEDNVRWICHELGGELLAERHFLPGLDRGEGFYVAAIKANQCSSSGRVFHPSQEDTLDLHPLYDSASFPSCGEIRIELSYDEALRYLRREALRIEAPRGMVTLCYRGLVLGQGKGVGNRINNLYPEPWRIRTTYTTPFSLLKRIERESLLQDG